MGTYKPPEDAGTPNDGAGDTPDSERQAGQDVPQFGLLRSLDRVPLNLEDDVGQGKQTLPSKHTESERAGRELLAQLKLLVVAPSVIFISTTSIHVEHWQQTCRDSFKSFVDGSIKTKHMPVWVSLGHAMMKAKQSNNLSRQLEAIGDAYTLTLTTGVPVCVCKYRLNVMIEVSRNGCQ